MYSPPLFQSVVIIDIGSCSVRAGILSDCDTVYPQRFFPSAAAVNHRNKDSVVYGFDAFTPQARANARVVFPLRRPPRLEQVTMLTPNTPSFILELKVLR